MSSPFERDLRLMVNSNLNESTVLQAVWKATHALGCIRLSTTSWVREMIILLYTALVQFHLEYCMHFCLPKYKKDVKLSESV